MMMYVKMIWFSDHRMHLQAMKDISLLFDKELSHPLVMTR